MTVPPVLFFFDLGSPYAWLSAERLRTVIPGEIAWVPVLLGGIFRRTSRSSWARTEERRAGMAEVERRAAEYGLPEVRWPEPWPADGLLVMRAATAARRAGLAEAFALAAFRAAFVHGRDLTDPPAVLNAAAAAGLDPETVRREVAEPAVKDELRAATDAAADRGVFGVPTFAVGDELFWGDDRLEAAAAALG